MAICLNEIILNFVAVSLETTAIEPDSLASDAGVRTYTVPEQETACSLHTWLASLGSYQSPSGWSVGQGPGNPLLLSPEICQSPDGCDQGLCFSHRFLQSRRPVRAPRSAKDRDTLSSLPTETYCQATPHTRCCCGFESTEIVRKHARLNLCHQLCGWVSVVLWSLLPTSQH